MRTILRVGYGVLLGGLVWFLLLDTTGCGSSSRNASRPGTPAPQVQSKSSTDIGMSMDPTEVPVIRLQDAMDSTKYQRPGDYIIGPDDKLKVSIFARNYTAESDEDEVIVRQDGKIYLKLLGEMQAVGLTVSQLQEAITRTSDPFVKQPFVQISILEYNSQAITLFGELGGGQAGGGRALRVPIKGPTRLLELLSTTVRESGQNAGSFSASPSIIADLSNIIVTKRNGERWRINLNTYLFGLNTAANIEVADGDFVFIPNLDDNRVFVLGEVNSPGPIQIGLGMSTVEAISRARGFTPVARRNSIKVIRGGMENPQVLSVPALDVAGRGRRDRDIYLRNGDIVYVPRNPLGDINIVLGQILPPIQTYLLIETLFNRK